jgi:hypothetical protein
MYDWLAGCGPASRCCGGPADRRRHVTIAGVQAVTLAQVADELYGLPPAEFTAARDERARVAKAAGGREDAAAIKKLARPTTSAWLVNQLSREAPDGLGRLFEVADALQEAQRTLAGDRLRELSAQRRQVVTELLPVAAAVADRAGQPASPAVLEEVRATLEAAVADNDARDAVRSGRLTRPLAYAGLGEVDLAAAVALAPASPPERPARPGRVPPAASGAARHGPAQAGRRPPRPGPADEGPAAGSAEPDAADLAAAAVAAAESAARDAVSAVSAAEHELTAISGQRQFLRRRISHLQGELAQTRQEDARLAADAQRAEQSRDAATRGLRAAERQLSRARRQQARQGDSSED